MSSVLRVCRKCGAEILSDAPEGLCTACLFETGLGLFLDGGVTVRDSSAAAAAWAKADTDGSVENIEANATAAARHTKKAARAAEMLGELGDYELLEEVGRGGQGVVFRARQKSLNRTVALKVISLGQWASKAHLKRFRLEAEAAARLDHPWIVPIYEVGERDGSCYFSMKFVEGGQLDEAIRRTPMPARQAAEITAKVACTVHYAHEHGILHRDIKPGNILLDAKGEPHLTDFGLARLVESQSSVTHTLEVLGTPSYMAPEQAVGNNAAVSSVTDVYGLGAVLYQLLTGHPPFAGGATYETIKLLLDTEPRPPRLLNPKVDRDLSTICLKCLEKDPARRYSSALALAEDLERWLKHEPIRARRTGPFTRTKKWARRNPAIAALITLSVALAAGLGGFVWKSELAQRPLPKGIAVMPFENLGDKENAFFADGLQDDILTNLAKIGDLKVISRTSVMQYRGAHNTHQIGKALRVSHVLEGSVRRAGTKVHLNAQLIDTQTDTHVWAEKYDRDLEDVLAIQNDISRGVVNALKIQLGTEEAQRLVKKPTQNLEAYDAYLLARFEFNKFSESGFKKAVEHFKHAIPMDPSFALAHAGLAEAYSALGYWNYLPPKESFPEAKRAALQALKLDPDLAEAHGALAYTEFQYEWKFKEAETEFKEAIRLNPNSASVRIRYAEYLFDFQRPQEGHEQLERARELDPLSIQIAVFFVTESFFARDFDRALERTQKAISMDPGNSISYYFFGQLLWKMNKPTEAFNAFQKSMTLDGALSQDEIGELRKAYDASGLSGYKRKQGELMEKHLAQGQYQCAYMIALTYATAGADNRKALDWLERAVEERSPWLPELKGDASWDDLRSQPRFVAVLKKIGLEK